MLKRKHEESLEVTGLQNSDQPTPLAAHRTPPSTSSPRPTDTSSKRLKTDTTAESLWKLTHETLCRLQDSVDPVRRPAAVEGWAHIQSMTSASNRNVDSSSGAHWPQTPTQSSAYSSASGVPQSRSASPGKSKQTDRAYRCRNLNFANVFVDVDICDIPEHVSACVASVRAAARVFASEAAGDGQTGISTIASEWRKQSRINIDDSLEADWQAGFRTVLDSLRILLGCEDLRFHSNQDWLSELKPSIDMPPSFLMPPPPVVPQKRSNQAETSDNPPGANDIPTPNSSPESQTRHMTVMSLCNILSLPARNDAALAAPATPAAPVASIEPTVPVLPPPYTPTPLSLKTPRPDIYTAISSNALRSALRPVHRLFLDSLERDGVLKSNPNPQAAGSHFPFFIVELKASATGGTLYQGQNQAAVSGASAVGILRELNRLHRASLPIVNQSDSETGVFTIGLPAAQPQQEQQAQDTHPTEAERRPRPANSANPTDSTNSIPPVVFSAVTEGPTHELWTHFHNPHTDAYEMACVGTYRSTDPESVLQLTCMVAAVLEYGARELKTRVVGMLRDVAGARGFLRA